MRERERPLLGSTSPDEGSANTRVVVVCNERLVRDAVCTALRSIGFVATSFGIPRGLVQVHAARRWITKLGPATGLLATDIVVVYMLTMAALYGLLDTAFVAFQRWVLRWKA